MFIHNESYDDKIMRLRFEMLLMHSKTGQALGLDKAEDFDSALEEATRAENTATALEQTPIAETPHRTFQSIPLSSGRGTLMADIDAFLSERARRLQRSNIPVMPQPEKPDTLIAEVAQRYAQATDVFGKHDTVFVAPA